MLVCDLINSEISLSFLVKPFVYLTTKSGQNCKYLTNEKKLLTWYKTHFSEFLKGFF